MIPATTIFDRIWVLFDCNKAEKKLLERTIQTANVYKKKQFMGLYAREFVDYSDSEDPDRHLKDLRGLRIGMVMDWESEGKSVMWVNLHKIKTISQLSTKSYMNTALKLIGWTVVDKKKEEVPESEAFKQLLQNYKVDPRGWIPYKYRG